MKTRPNIRKVRTGTGSRKPGTREVLRTPKPNTQISNQILDTGKGRIVSAGMGAVQDAISALDGFAESKKCRAWYKKSAEAMKRAVETGDPRCCSCIHDSSTNSDMENCSLDIGVEARSAAVAMAFRGLAESLEDLCRRSCGK